MIMDDGNGVRCVRHGKKSVWISMSNLVGRPYFLMMAAVCRHLRRGDSMKYSFPCPPL